MRRWTLDELYAEKEKLEDILQNLSKNPPKELEEKEIIRKRFDLIADLDAIKNKIQDMENEERKNNIKEK